jgi:hypothetical protein
MIVRRTILGAYVDMAENAEMQVGILIEDGSLRGDVGAEVPGDKVGIHAGLFGKLANQFAAGRPGVLEQSLAAIGGELR